jgi:signal transduction histidine kinase
LPALEPTSTQRQPEPLRAHGFTEPGGEDALRGLVQLAAVLGGGQAALELRDERRVWFRCGFPSEDWAVLEPLLAGGGWSRAELTDAGRGIGRLWARCEAHAGALALLANQIQLLVALRRELGEQRSRPRGPAGSSFVPGLVHEMRNFIFGISGSLDALQARFGGMAEVAKYQTVLRASVDRLNAFVDEVGDYGDPRPPAWADGNLELLLREAALQLRPRAAAAGVELRLELRGPLPPVRADEQGLCMAFHRMIGLALGHQAAGGRVTIHAEPGFQEDRAVIRGYVDSPRMELPGVDLSRLFEPFYFRASGFGRLALPVARRVLEQHGGKLSADQGPGGGVRLGFILPALAGAHHG